jgi:hypothetical protein
VYFRTGSDDLTRLLPSCCSTLLQGFRLFPTYVMRDAGPQHKADGLFSYAHVEIFLHTCWIFPTLSSAYVGFFRHFPSNTTDFSDIFLHTCWIFPTVYIFPRYRYPSFVSDFFSIFLQRRDPKTPRRYCSANHSVPLQRNWGYIVYETSEKRYVENYRIRYTLLQCFLLQNAVIQRRVL